MMDILGQLEQKRKNTGMTYKELAAKTGMMPDTVRGALQGWCKSDFYTIKRVARALGFDINVELNERKHQ